MNCKFNPVKLVVATTDEDLYDIDKKTWRWNGSLYWAVNCLQEKQTSISHKIAPNISLANYIKIDNSPSEWNFCNSKECNNKSTNIHIIFTFNPTSNDPEDFLQFVANINGNITDFPKNFIKDNSGNLWFINIEEIIKSNREKYVEIWIGKQKPASVLKSNVFKINKINNNSFGNIYFTIILIIISVFILFGLIYFIYQLLKKQPNINSTNIL